MCRGNQWLAVSGGATPFGFGFALGDSTSAAMHDLPLGAASWSGSSNTYFYVDPRRRAVALLMTHELTPGATAERTATLRTLLNRTAERLLGP